MKDWYAVFALALVIVVGSAAGLFGTVAFLLAFVASWYLLAAREVGFAQARTALAFRIEPPLWTRSNWRWLEQTFNDSAKLLKAAASALIVTACALMFGAPSGFAVALLIAAAILFAVPRDSAEPPLRAVRIRDAGADALKANLASPLVATAPPPASEAVAVVVVPTAEARSSIARPALGRLLVIRTPTALRKMRPVSRRGTSKPPAKRRPRKAVARPSRVKPLPALKRIAPLTLKSRKPPRPRPPLRNRRRLRKPMTLVACNGAAAPASAGNS